MNEAQECPVSKPHLYLMCKQVPTCVGLLSCPGYSKTHSHVDSHRQIRVTHANIFRLTAFSFKITWHSTSEAVTVASRKAHVVRDCGQWASTCKDAAPALKSDLLYVCRHGFVPYKNRNTKLVITCLEGWDMSRWLRKGAPQPVCIVRKKEWSLRIKQ